MPPVGAAPRREGTAQTWWKSPTALALLAANVLPVVGVLAWGWPVFQLMLLFWLENIVVGLLSAARMLCAQPERGRLWLAKLGMVPFFCVHYGMFTTVHGVFVFSLFGKAPGAPAGATEAEPDPARLIGWMDEQGLLLPLAALAASHVFSFAWNFLWRGEYRRAELPRLMLAPYGRVVVLHLVILFGAIAAQALGSPLWALLALVVMKTGLDLVAHLREHRAAAQAVSA